MYLQHVRYKTKYEYYNNVLIYQFYLIFNLRDVTRRMLGGSCADSRLSPELLAVCCSKIK